MAFIRIRGIPGKVYEPDKVGPRKHKCKDCFFCQMCSDERCIACLSLRKSINKNSKSEKHKKKK
ncbi:MAG: hypothetical protein ABFD79_10345 [Phycisphaerales bacterium]